MKNVLIITSDMCDDSELLYPYYRVLEEGYGATVASFTEKTVKCKYHFECDATHAVADINSADYDGLILPGGSAPEKLRQNADVIRLVREMHAQKKPIASICHGQQILISAKVLGGVEATCYPGIKDDLMNAGANYKDEPVVVCDNLVTSRRPQDLPYFMREFLKLMK